MTTGLHDRTMPPGAQRAEQLAAEARAADLRGNPDGALALYDQAIAALGTGPTPLLADLLRWKGTTHRERGETQRALELYERSLGVAVALRHGAAQAHALNCLGIIAQRRGDLKGAERYYAVAVAAAEGEPQLIGMIRQNGGVLADIRGDHDAARAAYEESLAAFEQAGNDEAACWVLNNLGMLHCATGEHDLADSAYDRGLVNAIRRGDKRMEGVIHLNQAHLRIRQERDDEAALSCSLALSLALERGDRLQGAEALRCRATLERRRGACDAAEATLHHAKTLAALGEDNFLSAEILRDLGEVCLERGRSAEAQEALKTAATSFSCGGATDNAQAVVRMLTLMRDDADRPNA